MAGIFICYRRADAEGWAGRLSDSLKAEVGRVNIFRDIEDIPPGVEFEVYINDAVGSCDVLIALIGPRWLVVTDKTGARRLDDPKDFTRLEILTALKRNVRVIPALVGGAQMPEMDALPEDIRSLARRQAYELSDSRWVDDCRKLANVLRPIVTPVRSQKIKVAVIALAALIALAAGGYGFKLWIDHRAEIARQEAAAKEKVEQEKVARQRAFEESQRQAELDRRRKEQEAQQQAALVERQKRESPPRVEKSQRERVERERAAAAQRTNARALPAPVLRGPACGSTIPRPREDHFFILSWADVEGASNYSVEVDCLGCSGRDWYSFRGSPWHVQTALGMRSPIYSSKIHVQLRQQGGLALRWRVWAVDHDGKEGQKSNWCQVAFSG